MREILFRGQLRRKGEKVNMAGEPLPSIWKYGGCAQYGGGAVIYQAEPEIEKFPVYADTVGQYTGLTDKNGVKIFEGDIVMTGVRYDKPYSKSRKGKRLIGKVEHHIGEGEGFFNDDTGKYDAHKMYSSEWKVTIPNIESKRKYCCYTWGDFFDCEVIGNIYDNPELMEEERE